MWGKDYLDALQTAREKMNAIEVDRTRVKPVVKITGEFWAQITEGDGNFHMFEFLEREGAQVLVEPIATWVAYLMYQAKAHAKAKWPVNRPHRESEVVRSEETFRERHRAAQEAVGHRRRASACGTTSTTAPSSIWAGSRTTWCRRTELARAGASLLQPVRARR